MSPRFRDKVRIRPSFIASAFAEGQSMTGCEFMVEMAFKAPQLSLMTMPKPAKGENELQEASVLIFTKPGGGGDHEETSS